mmetsp:Transcript_22588/g.40027  ORF Transcript_22588/g.40027 Transcript_22588/m.40027 type:complete len:147 (-) Transcript_22588:204-644(-)
MVKLSTAFLFLLICLHLFHQGRCSDSCEQLGFTKDLKCPDCDVLLKIVTDNELYNDCNACCSEDQNTSPKFTNAELEVCKYKLSAYPHLEKFIAKHAKGYSKLKVRYERFTEPKLKLFGKKVSETIRVDNYNLQQLQELLEAKNIS